MTLFPRLRSWFRSIPARIDGSRIPEDHDGLTRLHALAPTGGEFKAMKPRVYPSRPRPPVERIDGAPVDYANE